MPHIPKLLIVDNKDSFTWNIWQLALRVGADADVEDNKTATPALIRTKGYTHIVIGPGPMGPDASENSLDIINTLSGTLPILGICLGMQAIALLNGGRVTPKDLLHGGQDNIFHTGEGVHYNLPTPFRAARYNSLSVELPDTTHLTVTATNENGTIMAVQHKKDCFTEGIQYHPESFMTPLGTTIMEHFLLYDYHG